jgi:hypothetical protein
MFLCFQKRFSEMRRRDPIKQGIYYHFMELPRKLSWQPIENAAERQKKGKSGLMPGMSGGFFLCKRLSEVLWTGIDGRSMGACISSILLMRRSAMRVMMSRSPQDKAIHLGRFNDRVQVSGAVSTGV